MTHTTIRLAWAPVLSQPQHQLDRHPRPFTIAIAHKDFALPLSEAYLL